MERCLRVIPINERIDQVNGGWAVLTTLELWDDCVVVRFVSGQLRIPEMPAPADVYLQLRAFGWDLSDDVGTEYEGAGAISGGGNDGAAVLQTALFTPAVPEDATLLRLFAADSAAEHPLEVPLS